MTSTKQYIAQHINDDINSLALKSTPPDVDKQFALQQIEARQKLRSKVPSWAENDDLLFPPRLTIEQCSSEATARYKAQLVEGDTFSDLSGGLGIDCYYMSQKFNTTDYIEQNSNLCDIAKHNFGILNANINIINLKSSDYLNNTNSRDCLYIDPARRDSHGRKVMLLSDCEPDIRPMLDIALSKSPRMLVKLSPMLDITAALKEIKSVKDIHIIAVANECKELLMDVIQNYKGKPHYHCCNLSSDQPSIVFAANDEDDAASVVTDSLHKYLYEPNAAIMKSGFFKATAKAFNIGKLHPISHLYTSDTLIANFPGRVFEIDSCHAFGKKNIKEITGGLIQANITTRNFPLQADELRKKLSLREGGNAFLFATTLSNGEKVILRCHKAMLK